MTRSKQVDTAILPYFWNEVVISDSQVVGSPACTVHVLQYQLTEQTTHPKQCMPIERARNLVPVAPPAAAAARGHEQGQRAAEAQRADDPVAQQTLLLGHKEVVVWEGVEDDGHVGLLEKLLLLLLQEEDRLVLFPERGRGVVHVVVGVLDGEGHALETACVSWLLYTGQFSHM